MSFPASWARIPVTATYLLRDEAGTPATGRVEFRSSQIVVADGSIIVPVRVTATLDSDGHISLLLPATDDPDVQPNSWTWTVTEVIDRQPRRSYSLSIPHTASSIDLSSIAPIPPGQPVYDYLLTSAIGATVAGQGDLDALDGRVTALEEAGEGVQLSDDTPESLGTASAGVSTEASRSDHVHPMPSLTVADVTGAVGTTDPRLSDARTPLAHQHPSTDISDSTATGRAVLTAADAAAARTVIGVAAIIGFDSKADMDADLAHDAGTLALVTNDATAANNGTYRKTGASGSGAWVLIADRVSGLESEVAALDDYTDALDGNVLSYVQTVNLYNPAKKQVGKYLVSNGTISDTAGWACTEFFPVVAGQTYTISANSARRAGSAFFTAPDVSTMISGSYNSSTTNPQTRIAPAGAAYMLVNLQSNTIPEPTEFMINAGSTALPYEPWHAPIPQVKTASITGTGSPAELSGRIDDLEDAFELSYGKNLYNPASKRMDAFLDAGSGNIGTGAGWACTEFIPVEPGQTYTISANANKRVGAAFYSTDEPSGDGFIAGSGSFGAVNESATLTLTAPAGAAFFVMNVQSNTIPEPSAIQVEVGESATAFEAWRAPVSVPKNLPPEIETRLSGVEDELAAFAAAAPAAFLLSTSPVAGATRLTVPLGSHQLEWRVSPFLAANHNAGYLWNFNSFYVDGVSQSVNSSDDVAPYRMFGTTIGANHGYTATACTLAGHGKTLADVGSVWSDGTNQWVIVAVPDSSIVKITKRTGNTGFTLATLTHVSGATHTESFTPTSVDSSPWFPVHNNHKLMTLVDGIPVSAAATYYPRKNVAFAESYDILDKDSLTEWLITQAGTATDIFSYQGTAAVTVSQVFSFDLHGGMTITTDFLSLQAVTAFQDIMFTQAYRLAATGGVLKYLIPDTVSLTHESVTYDFSKPVDMTAWAPATRLDITTARIANQAVWPDRVVQFNGSVGMAVGYLPIRDAEPAVRPTLAARKALQISEITKIYMSAIDSASHTSLAAGDYFSVVAYRAFFALSADRTASYVVRGPDADWLFVDWHASIHDRLPLPPDLQGRAYTLHRKTSGVTIRSAYATDSIVFDVATTDGAGQYAILKFAR